jgi:hypothetical protein
VKSCHFQFCYAYAALTAIILDMVFAFETARKGRARYHGLGENAE